MSLQGRNVVTPPGITRRGTGMPDKKLPVSVGSATRRAVESVEGTRTIEQRRTRRQNKQTGQGGRGEGEGERGGACLGLCGGHAGGLGEGSGESRVAGIGARHNKLPVSVAIRWRDPSRHGIPGGRAAGIG